MPTLKELLHDNCTSNV